MGVSVSVGVGVHAYMYTFQVYIHDQVYCVQWSLSVYS